MIYRYRKIIDEYTTHIAALPDDDAFDHGEFPSGYTYVAFPGPVPDQPEGIVLEPVSLTPEMEEAALAGSPHCVLMQQRVNAGVYIDETNHIVKGTPEQVEAWRQDMLRRFKGDA